MGLDRSKLVTPNVARNIAATQKGKVFENVPQDATRRYRFYPTLDPDGLIWYVTTNHFKLKEATDEEGKTRGVAIACNNEHGEEGDCYLCRVQVALSRHGDKALKAIGKSIKCNSRYNAQVAVAEKTPEGIIYFGPRILGLPKGASEAVAEVMKNQEEWNQPLFTDVKEGQDLLIGRTGTGFDTKYKVDRSGENLDLDVIMPEWGDDFIDDMFEALGLRILTNEQQKATLKFSFGDSIDWDMLAEDFGL